MNLSYFKCSLIWNSIILLLLFAFFFYSGAISFLWRRILGPIGTLGKVSWTSPNLHLFSELPCSFTSKENHFSLDIKFTLLLHDGRSSLHPTTTLTPGTCRTGASNLFLLFLSLHFLGFRYFIINLYHLSLILKTIIFTCSYIQHINS